MLFPHQHLQGMVAHGDEGVDGAGHPVRSVPGAQVVVVVRQGLYGEVGLGWCYRRRRLGFRFPGMCMYLQCNSLRACLYVYIYLLFSCVVQHNSKQQQQQRVLLIYRVMLCTKYLCIALILKGIKSEMGRTRPAFGCVLVRGGGGHREKPFYICVEFNWEAVGSQPWQPSNVDRVCS